LQQIPGHNRALFGEEFAKKFSPEELSGDMYDIITETGKQLKLAYCPPNVREKFTMKYRRVTETVRNMAKESTSAFMKPIHEAHRKGTHYYLIFLPFFLSLFTKYPKQGF
jgi:hypothetical protein